MAVINGKADYRQHNVMLVEWTSIPQSSTGTPDQLTRWPAATVQFSGTFGATAILEGSDDGVTYFTLVGQNSAGASVPISTTAAAIFVFDALPLHIRPSVGAGSGATSVTVTIVARGFGA